MLIEAHLLIPCHVYKHTIYQIITLSKQITNINLSDTVVLFEAPKWKLLERPSMEIFESPLGFRIDDSFDVKCQINSKWYHGKVVDLCHMSKWKDSLQNEIYQKYQKKHREKEKDLRSLWRIKIHFVGWPHAFDEWIRCDDDLRISKAGTHCSDIPSNIKYPLILPKIPQFVITLRCLHRRLIKSARSFWSGRDFEVRVFGCPFLIFLPKNGFTALELYHFVWNRLRIRFLNEFQTNFCCKENGNSLSNAYLHIFGGHTDFNPITPPFVLRRVDKFGAMSSQQHWHEYSMGTLIHLSDNFVNLSDGEYVSIDWNDRIFATNLNQNALSLVFERGQCLDDASVTRHFAQYSKSISIGDCIREFQKEETLTEYFCEQCNSKNEATKSLQIWSTPPILIFHFKRTANFGRKIGTNVDYLLNNFDVAPFLVPRSDENELKKEEEEETRYNLFGAINHYGAAGGGHYIANCLCMDVNAKQRENENEKEALPLLKWYLFDDHRVSTVSPMDVKTKNAYLLFYIRSDIQEMFVEHLMKEREKLFDVEHIQIDKHFEFLPESVRNLIGNELTAEQVKLLNSEGVETTATRNCVIL